MKTVSNQSVSKTVTVFGATGHTGRFVVDALLQRGMVPVAVARDAGKLAQAGFAERGIVTRRASVDDVASLDAALQGVAAVINCAGPFLETANPLAAVAVRNGVHYLDVTAEQPSAQQTLSAFDDAAREAGVHVIPAMGFYGGLADLLATAAIGDWDAVDDIRIGIALNSWHPTEGTRITGARNTTQRLVVAGGELVPVTPNAPGVTWDFPAPFGSQEALEVPFSEVVLLMQHLKIGQLRSYLNKSALQDVRDPNTPQPVASDDSGKSSQLFMVEVIAVKDGKTRKIVAQGRDIYAFTAPLISEAVLRILQGEVRKSGGANAPGAIFDARSFLRALAPELQCTFD